jgi:hypothetical protein
MDYLNNSIIQAGIELKKKLREVDIDSFEISDYNKRYFGSLIKDEQSLCLNVDKYSYLLKLVLKKYNYDFSDKPVFLDYGSGHGMMTLLAKESNLFSKVVYSDIFEQSAIDAQGIANKLNLKSDYYIVGDVNDVINFSNQNSIRFNIMTSYDVLEHIYDIDDFISNLKFIFDKSYSFVMGSGANPLNPLIAKRLRKLHVFYENFDREQIFGRKSTDTVLSLKRQREGIIRDFFFKNSIELQTSEFNRLVLSSRGLIVSDIEKYLLEFIVSGNFDYTPDDPTNTCDALTGNWFERLMDPYNLQIKFNCEFENIYVDHGYYYSIFSDRNFIPKFFINLLMKLIPTKASIRLAPYYIIHGINS